MKEIKDISNLIVDTKAKIEKEVLEQFLKIAKIGMYADGYTQITLDITSLSPAELLLVTNCLNGVDIALEGRVAQSKTLLLADTDCVQNNGERVNTLLGALSSASKITNLYFTHAQLGKLGYRRYLAVLETLLKKSLLGLKNLSLANTGLEELTTDEQLDLLYFLLPYSGNAVNSQVRCHIGFEDNTLWTLGWDVLKKKVFDLIETNNPNMDLKLWPSYLAIVSHPKAKTWDTTQRIEFLRCFLKAETFHDHAISMITVKEVLPEPEGFQLLSDFINYNKQQWKLFYCPEFEKMAEERKVLLLRQFLKSAGHATTSPRKTTQLIPSNKWCELLLDYVSDVKNIPNVLGTHQWIELNEADRMRIAQKILELNGLLYAHEMYYLNISAERQKELQLPLKSVVEQVKQGKPLHLDFVPIDGENVGVLLEAIKGVSATVAYFLIFIYFLKK